MDERLRREKGREVTINKGESSSNITSCELEIVNVEPGEALEAACKRKLHRQFQDNWATQMPWVQAIIGEDGNLSHMKCNTSPRWKVVTSFWWQRLMGFTSMLGGRRLTRLLLGEEENQQGRVLPLTINR